jgi:hypothetical protein
MKPMPSKALARIRLVLLLVAALSVGLHLALVQVVGWVNMAVEFSHSLPLTEALVKTFDGKHPCELCKLVANELGKSEQLENPLPEQKSEPKWPPVVCWAESIEAHHCHSQRVSVVKLDTCARFRRERPPLLPPRGEV